MSLDVSTTSTTEKRDKKSTKEKKPKKEPKQAEVSAAPTSIVPPADTGTDGQVKKRKREEGVSDASEATLESEEARRKREKKERKTAKGLKREQAAGAVAEDTPVSAGEPIPAAPATSAPTVATETSATQSSKDKKNKEGKKSKKSKKSKPNADSAPTISTTGTSSVPQPAIFTSSHTAFLTENNITLNPHLYPPHLLISTLAVQASILSFLSQFKSPTPIQACSWPPLLAGRDVVGIAETGSGKTLAFGVPGMNRLAILGSAVSAGAGAKAETNGTKGKDTGGKSPAKMVVVAPTRELAQQSFETLQALGKTLGVECICLFGGVGKDDQIRGLKKAGIVVGTPGRMLDLANDGSLDLSQ
jgi:ATP-dependent RNA helicase DBP3